MFCSDVVNFFFYCTKEKAPEGALSSPPELPRHVPMVGVRCFTQRPEQRGAPTGFLPAMPPFDVRPLALALFFHLAHLRPNVSQGVLEFIVFH